LLERKIGEKKSKIDLSLVTQCFKSCTLVTERVLQYYRWAWYPYSKHLQRRVDCGYKEKNIGLAILKELYQYDKDETFKFKKCLCMGVARRDIQKNTQL